MPDHYFKIARFYDDLNSDQKHDIEFYLHNLEGDSGPFLDVGCGSGRIIFPILNKGFLVHGIDKEMAMLKLAKDRAKTLNARDRKRLHLFYGDAINHKFMYSYGLIALSYNFFMHIHRIEDQVKLLTNLKETTQSNTRLILDLPHPTEIFLSQDSDTLLHERDIINPDNGHLIQVYSRSNVDISNQIIDVSWIYDEINESNCLTRTVANQRLRFFTLAELKLLLKLSGWKEKVVYGNYDFTPFDDESARLLIVASVS